VLQAEGKTDDALLCAERAVAEAEAADEQGVPERLRFVGGPRFGDGAFGPHQRVIGLALGLEHGRAIRG
jgi:hypothetical protein